MDIAIDLGTSRTRIFFQNKGIVLDEPSVVAYSTNTLDTIAVGRDAYDMLGKTPPGICAVYPLAHGVISDSGLVCDMVNIFMQKVTAKRVIMPRVIACIPGEITEVEQRAAINAINSYGVRRVHLLEAAKAAAIGSGMPYTKPHGSLVVNVGAGTTEVAVITLGGISAYKTVKLGGNHMDDEIIRYVRRRHNLHIGHNMAEKCKIAIGTLTDSEEKNFTLKGRHTIENIPRSASIKSSEIRKIIFETADKIVGTITAVLEITMPELLGDIYADGLVLCGGLANLSGFAELCKKRTGLDIRIPENPENCVINGCGAALELIESTDFLREGELAPSYY